MSSAGSFFKFVLGFLTFISVSFVITFAANSAIIAQQKAEKSQQAAAAIQAMLQ